MRIGNAIVATGILLLAALSGIASAGAQATDRPSADTLSDEERYSTPRPSPGTAMKAKPMRPSCAPSPSSSRN